MTDLQACCGVPCHARLPVHAVLMGSRTSALNPLLQREAREARDRASERRQQAQSGGFSGRGGRGAGGRGFGGGRGEP